MKAHHLGYRLANFQNHVTYHLGDININAQEPPLQFKSFIKCEMIQLKCQEFSPRLRNVDVRKRRKFLEKKQSTHIRQRGERIWPVVFRSGQLAAHSNTCQ